MATLHVAGKTSKLLAVMPDSLQLLDRLAAHAADRPGAVAYRDAGNHQSLTWRTLADRVTALGRRLASAFPAGGVVMLCAANQIEYPVAFLGILASGCDVFPVSAEIAEAELLRAADQAGAVALIGHDRACQILAQHRPAVIALPLPSGEGWGEGQAALASSKPSVKVTHPAPHPNPLPAGERAKPSLLLQSSGTTGLPKIVRRSWRSLDSVSAAMADAVGFTRDDHVLAAVPLTHSYGLEHGLLAPIWAGSTVHLVRGLDVPTVLTELAGNQITIFPGVPAMFELLANVSDALPIRSLRTAYSAGAPLPTSVTDRFAARFNVRVTQLYGATEIGSVTFNDPNESSFDSASVGKPMAGVEIHILNVTTNLPLATGEEGHVAIRAASMFDGYLPAAEALAGPPASAGGVPADLIDGFFPTGDLGKLDASGRLFITGRIKLLIDVGGMKVNPFEVENVLCQHPRVAECVVVPMRQSETVSRLMAVVTPRDQASPPTIDDLRAFAKSQLSAYKVPRAFEIRATLPHSATGKVLRHVVESSL